MLSTSFLIFVSNGVAYFFVKKDFDSSSKKDNSETIRSNSSRLVL